MKGTLLNTATIAAGATLALLVERAVPPSYEAVALAGLGLVTLGMGMRLFFQSRNVLAVAAAVALGGVLGTLLGVQAGLEAASEWARQAVGGGGRFTEGLLAASVLFCVGPMTLLGCIKDGLSGDRELLSVKSTMDGVAAFFLGASLGRGGAYGVLMSAVVVLLVQGGLTLAARPLRRVADDDEYMAAASGAGGVILMAIALSLLELKRLPTADYLPALLLGPLFVWLGRRAAALQARA